MKVLSERTKLMVSTELFQLGSTVLLFPGVKTNKTKKNNQKALCRAVFLCFFLMRKIEEKQCNDATCMAMPS